MTGSTGGVGSLACAILSKKGYQVVASTGKPSEHDFLKQLGVTEVISREQVVVEKVKALDKQLWAAAVDPVGGETLAAILSKIQYGGAVAVSGLTGGPKVPTTVFPFILRSVKLLGIDSVYCPMDVRLKVWDKMADDDKPSSILLQSIEKEITFDTLPKYLPLLLKGQARGRFVVKL